MESVEDTRLDFLRDLFLTGYVWHEQAACRHMDPDIFVSMETKHPEHLTVQAKAVCENCLVKAECLRAGIDGEEHGIWGGTTREERLVIIRKASAVRNGRA